MYTGSYTKTGLSAYQTNPNLNSDCIVYELVFIRTMETNRRRKIRQKGEGTLNEERKRKRSEGKSYMTKSNIIIKEKVEPKSEAVCKCKYECKGLSHELKKKLFHDFYSLQDNVKQNSYLMGLITIVPVKRRRHGQYSDCKDSKRQASICFTLPNGNGNLVQVCKATFMDIFAITKRRIETLAAAKKKGDVVYTEKRGNKTQNRKYNVDDEVLVINHVNSFPKDESHYGRRKSNKEYLSQDLNINRLYFAFKKKYPETNITYRYYYQTFKKKFRALSFHRPRTDTCGTCDLLSAKIKANPNDGDSKIKLQNHHSRAQIARDKMKDDHALSQLPTSNNCTISIDLEQVLSLPSLRHGEMFYLRQLSCFNLCIHVADNNKGHKFLWNEGITGRGGSQIASCIFKAINNMVTLKRNLTVWSDNCWGQNKNRMLTFLWIYLTIKGHVDEVNQKFVVPGHSFLSCDRDFAQIEKRKRRERCEVPIDLVKIIVEATPNNPFEVTLMQPEDFYDFKAAADSVINIAKMNISKCSWIRVTKDEPEYVFVRKTLDESEKWTKLKLFKKGVNVDLIRYMALPQLQLKSKITEGKKEDLKKMLPYLKEENRNFYEEILK